MDEERDVSGGYHRGRSGNGIGPSGVLSRGDGLLQVATIDPIDRIDPATGVGERCALGADIGDFLITDQGGGPAVPNGAGRAGDTPVTTGEPSGPAAQDFPWVPGVELGVGVVRGLEDHGGRDFYDVLALPGGCLALVVGHVPANGCAGVVERLRGALAVQLLQEHTPTEVLYSLHRYAGLLPESSGTSLCLVLFDPVRAAVECVSAGHPSPLVLAPDGTVRQMVGEHTGPLGVDPTVTVVPVSARTPQLVLDPTETLLLHTPGAMRRAPGTGSPGARFVQLAVQTYLGEGPSVARTDTDGDDARAASGAPVETPPWPMGPAELCDRLADRLGERPPGIGGEGAVLLALSPHHLPDAFTLSFPAQPEQLVVARRALREWLNRLGVPEEDVQALAQAVGEATANAVEHAYTPEERGTVRLRGTVEADGTVEVVVADGGRWRPPPTEPGTRGRGLLLMRESVDEVEVNPSPIGTSVTLRKFPRWEGTLDEPVSKGVSRPVPLPFSVDVERHPGRVRVTVCGDLPERFAPTLRRELLNASRGGVLPVAVDLGQLGEITAGAVRALFDVAVAAQASGQRLRVIVPGESPVADALALARLDRLADLVCEHGE